MLKGRLWALRAGISDLLFSLVIVDLVLCPEHDLMIIRIGHSNETHQGAHFDLVWHGDNAVLFDHLEVTVDILDDDIVANATAINLVWLVCRGESDMNEYRIAP